MDTELNVKMCAWRGSTGMKALAFTTTFRCAGGNSALGSLMLQARRVEGRASVGLEPVRIWSWGPPGRPFHPPALTGLFGEACMGLSFIMF